MTKLIKTNPILSGLSQSQVASCSRLKTSAFCPALPWMWDQDANQSDDAHWKPLHNKIGLEKAFVKPRWLVLRLRISCGKHH